MSSIKGTTFDEMFGEGELDHSKVLSDQELKDVPSEEKLRRLRTLCYEQIAIESDIAALEQQLAAKKEELFKVSEVEIPSLFDEIDIEGFQLKNGMTVEVVPYYSGKVTTPEAMEWLDENGHGDIVKGKLTVPYPKGFDQSQLRALVKLAESLGLTADNREEVHHSTLRAWIREMVETGQEFPRELFNVYVGRKTRLSLK